MVVRGEEKGRVVVDGMNDDLLAGEWSYAGMSAVGLSGVSRGYESGPRRMNLPLQKITKYSPGSSACEVVWFKDREDPSNDGKIRPSVDKTRIYPLLFFYRMRSFCSR